MCKYCTIDKNGDADRILPKERNTMSAYIRYEGGKEFFIVGSSTLRPVKIPINYCPICGGKLDVL